MKNDIRAAAIGGLAATFVVAISLAPKLMNNSEQRFTPTATITEETPVPVEELPTSSTTTTEAEVTTTTVNKPTTTTTVTVPIRTIVQPVTQVITINENTVPLECGPGLIFWRVGGPPRCLPLDETNHPVLDYVVPTPPVPVDRPLVTSTTTTTTTTSVSSDTTTVVNN